MPRAPGVVAALRVQLAPLLRGSRLSALALPGHPTTQGRLIASNEYASRLIVDLTALRLKGEPSALCDTVNRDGVGGHLRWPLLVRLAFAEDAGLWWNLL